MWMININQKNMLISTPGTQRNENGSKHISQGLGHDLHAQSEQTSYSL